MASKAAMEKGEQRSSKLQDPGALKSMSGGVMGAWDNMTRFLSDVRAEMRKVVAPTRKEVESTTTVVIITVFLFGAFFWLVDLIFKYALQGVIQKFTAGQ
ncbi:MAG: preprotein translocase subunit SecE [Terracidiphilus sp.]